MATVVQGARASEPCTHIGRGVEVYVRPDLPLTDGVRVGTRCAWCNHELGHVGLTTAAPAHIVPIILDQVEARLDQIVRP